MTDLRKEDRPKDELELDQRDAERLLHTSLLAVYVLRALKEPRALNPFRLRWSGRRKPAVRSDVF